MQFLRKSVLVTPASFWSDACLLHDCALECVDAWFASVAALGLTAAGEVELDSVDSGAVFRSSSLN